MLLAEPIQITHRIAQEFERLRIRYLVGGSLASSLHGIPRAPNDVDMVAEMTEAHIPLLVKALETEFYIDAEMIQDAIQHQSSFNVIHLTTMFKVDIFVLKTDVASQEEMTRRGQYQISDTPDQSLFLASAEDVIVHKLYWYQLSGSVSERQWTDGNCAGRHFTAEAPQYDLPDLRGKQSSQRLLLFLFFVERPKNKKK